MIPFYIYYSMFGFQRVGDLAWAAGDSRARGFLLGGTAGRTTLNGEGLQHEDGHSHSCASTIPNCVAYDPTYGYELAVIIQDGLRRMCAEQEDVFYYLTVMNENYPHPAMPEGAEEGILRGHVPAARGPRATAPRVQLHGLGHDPARGARRRRPARARTSASSADVWSVTSFTELRRDGHRAPSAGTGCTRPRSRARPCVEQCARRAARARWSPRPTTSARSPTDPAVRAGRPYRVLGTDGFGRSDYRVKLRRFFEVDRHHVAVAALQALADEGTVEPRWSSRRSSSTRSTPSRRRRASLTHGDRVVETSWSPTSGTSPTSRSSRSTSRRATRSPPEDPLVTLESDKATMDVPSPLEGVVQELKVAVGDTVSEGTR